METKITKKSLKKPGKMFKPMGLAIDTEEINKLYTFGGEQGKQLEKNEDDFLIEIYEMAKFCRQ